MNSHAAQSGARFVIENNQFPITNINNLQQGFAERKEVYEKSQKKIYKPAARVGNAYNDGAYPGGRG